MLPLSLMAAVHCQGAVPRQSRGIVKMSYLSLMAAHCFACLAGSDHSVGQGGSCCWLVPPYLITLVPLHLVILVLLHLITLAPWWTASLIAVLLLLPPTDGWCRLPQGKCTVPIAPYPPSHSSHATDR